MENTNEPQPTVTEVVESTVQTARNDQVQPPVVEPATGEPVEAETPSRTTFSIQDLVQHDTEPEFGEGTFKSYTGYWRKQAQPSKLLENEGNVQEQEGDPSQGSSQEDTTQAENESMIPGPDEPPYEAQEQGMVVTDEGEKGGTDGALQKEQEPEPLKEDTTL